MQKVSENILILSHLKHPVGGSASIPKPWSMECTQHSWMRRARLGIDHHVTDRSSG